MACLLINLKNLKALESFADLNSSQEMDQTGDIHHAHVLDQPSTPHSSSAAALTFVHARLRQGFIQHGYSSD